MSDSEWEVFKRLAKRRKSPEANTRDILDLLAQRDRLAKATKDALAYLESDHVQNNLFRMGLLGTMDVESAVKRLRRVSRKSP